VEQFDSSGRYLDVITHHSHTHAQPPQPAHNLRHIARCHSGCPTRPMPPGGSLEVEQFDSSGRYLDVITHHSHTHAQPPQPAHNLRHIARCHSGCPGAGEVDGNGSLIIINHFYFEYPPSRTTTTHACCHSSHIPLSPYSPVRAPSVLLIDLS